MNGEFIFDDWRLLSRYESLLVTCFENLEVIMADSLSLPPIPFPAHELFVVEQITPEQPGTVSTKVTRYNEMTKGYNSMAT